MGGKSLWIGDTKVEAKAVGFDKDGTLFDAVAFWVYIDTLRKQQFLNLAGEEHEEQWEKLMGIRGAGEVDHNGVLAVATTLEEIILTAGAFYQLKGWPWTECKAKAESVFRLADENTMLDQAFQAKEGASEVILSLLDEGIRTGILTSDKWTRAEQCMDLLGVKERLDFLITPEQVEKGKPSPDMVFKACEQLGISPHELVVVGDSVVDMKMAKAAGSIAVGIVTYDGSREALSEDADFLIDSLLEIRTGS